MTPERNSQADEAARYVLDQLSPAARQKFEVQLTQSAELRALVQEMEEGAEAMARTAPQESPPPQAWSAIEQAIMHESRRKVIVLPIWSNWWRNGWAVAAACFVAFLAYAWWPQSKEHSPIVSPPAMVEPTVGIPPAAYAPIKSVTVLPTTRNLSNAVESVAKAMAEAEASELASLRWQVAALKSELQQLSGVVSQQKAILTEPGRFKFFPLAHTAPGTTGTGATPAPPLSAGLQRAMFYAMARDMGWLPNLAKSGPQTGATETSARVFAGIDFVDLNAGQARTASGASAGIPTSEELEATAAEPVSVSPSGTIPGFAGTNLVMLFDRSIIPQGGPITFWTAAELHNNQLLGSAVLGDNPMVVTLPMNGVGDGTVTVVANPTGGPSNVVGYFQILRASPSGGRVLPSQ